MKRFISLAIACCLVTVFGNAAEETGAAAKPELVSILKCFDHAKVMTYKIATQGEYKTLLEELAAEAKLWDKAMAASEKAWKADTATSKKSFPKNAISARKVQLMESFTDPEKATNRLNDLEKKLAENEEADKKRAEEAKKQRNSTATKILGDRANKKKDDKGTSDRDALLESARSLFESKLTELAGGSTGAQPAPAPAAAEPEKKEAKNK